MDAIRSWWEVPCVTHFSYLFRKPFKLPDFDIEDLEDALLVDHQPNPSSLLKDLHIQFLKGILGKPVDDDNWELLLKLHLEWRSEFLHETYNPLEGEKHYKDLKMREKIELLHRICHWRLELDDIGDALRNTDGFDMRVDPVGRDSDGNHYWYFIGSQLYRESAEHYKRCTTGQKEGGGSQRGSRGGQSARSARKRGGKGRVKRNAKEKEAATEENADDVDKTEDMETKAVAEDNPEPEPGWTVVCTTVEEWEGLIESLKEHKTGPEKHLCRILEQDYLPEIIDIITQREKELKRRQIEVLPRRQSDRLAIKATVKEEHERLLALEREQQREEERKRRLEERERRKQEEEEQRRQRRMDAEKRAEAQEEEQTKQREEEDKHWTKALSGELSGPRKAAIGAAQNVTEVVNTVTKVEEDDELSELYVSLYKICGQLRKHEDCWVFIDPVTEEIAPGYFDIIEKPMDIVTIEKNLEERKYVTHNEFVADVNLIFDNCLEYNGDDSEYSEMAENVRKSFKQLVKKHLESESPTTTKSRKRAKTEDESDYEEGDASGAEEETDDEEEEESGDDSDFELNGPKKKKRKGAEANAMSKADEYRMASQRMPGMFPGGQALTPQQQQNAMMAQMYHRQMMMQQRGMYPGHPGMHPEAYRQQMAAAAAAAGGGGPYPSRLRPPPPSYASHFPPGAYQPSYRPPPHPHGMPPGSQPSPSANGPHPQAYPHGMWGRHPAPYGPSYPPGAMPGYPYPYAHPGAPQGMYRGYPPGAMALGPDGKPIGPPTAPRADTPSSQRSGGSKLEDEAEKGSDKASTSGEGQKEGDGDKAPEEKEAEGSKEEVDAGDKKEGEVSSSGQPDVAAGNPGNTALSPSQEAGRTGRPSTSQSPQNSPEAIAAAREAYRQRMMAHANAAAQSHGMPAHPGYPYPPQPYNPAQMGGSPKMPQPYSPQHPSQAHYGQRPWGYYPPGHAPPGVPQTAPEQEAYFRWKQQQYYVHQRRMQMAAAQQAAMATATSQQQSDAAHSTSGTERQRSTEADPPANPTEENAVTQEADEIPDYQESLVKLAMGITSSKEEKKDSSPSKDEGEEEEDGVKARNEAPSSNSDETVSSSDAKGEAEPSSSSSGAKKQQKATTTVHHGAHPHRNPHEYPYPPYHPGGYPHPAYHHPEAQWGQWPHPHMDRRGYPMHPGQGYPHPPPHMQQGMVPPIGAAGHPSQQQMGQISQEEHERYRFFQRTMNDHFGAMQGPGAFAGPPPHMYPQHPSQVHPSHQHPSHPHLPPNRTPSLPSAVKAKQQGEAADSNHQETGGKESPKVANVNGEVPSEEDDITSTSANGKLNAVKDHSGGDTQAPPTTEEGEAENMDSES